MLPTRMFVGVLRTLLHPATTEAPFGYAGGSGIRSISSFIQVCERKPRTETSGTREFLPSSCGSNSSTAATTKQRHHAGDRSAAAHRVRTARRRGPVVESLELEPQGPRQRGTRPREGVAGSPRLTWIRAVPVSQPTARPHLRVPNRLIRCSAYPWGPLAISYHCPFATSPRSRHIYELLPLPQPRSTKPDGEQSTVGCAIKARKANRSTNTHHGDGGGDRRRDELVEHGAGLHGRFREGPATAGERRRRRRGLQRWRHRREQGLLADATFPAARGSGQDEPGREQDPRGHGGGRQEHARRGLLLHGATRRPGLPAVHAPPRRPAAPRRRLQQRALQIQVDALAGHSFRRAQLRGGGGADEERQAGARGGGAQLPRRVRGGARQRRVPRAGDRAAGGVRGAGRPAARRRQGHVRRGQAVHEGEQHAHGPLEEAQVHAGQVARHARADGGRRGGGDAGGGGSVGDRRLAREADQVQGVHADLRLWPDRGRGRVMDT